MKFIGNKWDDFITAWSAARSEQVCQSSDDKDKEDKEIRQIKPATIP